MLARHANRINAGVNPYETGYGATQGLEVDAEAYKAPGWDWGIRFSRKTDLLGNNLAASLVEIPPLRNIFTPTWVMFETHREPLDTNALDVHYRFGGGISRPSHMDRAPHAVLNLSQILAHSTACNRVPHQLQPFHVTAVHGEPKRL